MAAKDVEKTIAYLSLQYDRGKSIKKRGAYCNESGLNDCRDFNTDY
jgi:hypothetical protein